MNLFWAIVRNVTAALRFESVRRFKTLPLLAKRAAWFCGREAVFAGPHGNHFRCGKQGMMYL
jgi:hypothetical protein